MTYDDEEDAEPEVPEQIQLDRLLMTRVEIQELAEATGRPLRAVARTFQDQYWYKINRGTAAQQAAVRQYAQEKGFINPQTGKADLRRLWSEMSAETWDYYNVLRIFYGR